jgi:hypothetical protein
MADKKLKLPYGRKGSNSFCVDMTEQDCNKAKVACQWTKEGQRKAHCKRRVTTKANTHLFAPFNGKKPVFSFSTKVTIVLAMVDEYGNKLEFPDDVKDDIQGYEDYIVNPVLGVLNLGDSYSYPDNDFALSVKENFISFRIDLEDEENSGEKLTPKSYEEYVEYLNSLIDKFNDRSYDRGYGGILYEFDTDSNKQNKISCYVEKIYLLEL